MNILTKFACLFEDAYQNRKLLDVDKRKAYFFQGNDFRFGKCYTCYWNGSCTMHEFWYGIGPTVMININDLTTKGMNI